MAFILFLLWTFVLFARPQDFFSFLNPLRPALLLTGGMLFTSFINGDIRFTEIFREHAQVKRYYLLYLLMILGVPFSAHAGNSFDFVLFIYLPNILYFSFFIIYIDTLEKLKKVLYIICLSALFYAGLSLVSTGFTAGRFGFGTMYDPNDLAYFLISVFPLSFYFLGKEQAKVKRLIAALTIMVCLIVSLLTGSRGGLLGLVIVGFFLFFSRFSPFKLMQKLILLALLTSVLAMNMDKIDTERFSTILNPEQDYNVQSEEGRLAVWQRGWQLSLRHPFTGVGVNAFHVAIGRYRVEIGEVPRWQAPHNPFVQILTELGFPGLLIYLVMTVGAVKTFMTTARDTIPATDTHTELAIISRAMLIGFMGNLAAAFFLSMAYSALFALFIALSAVVLHLRHAENYNQIEIDPEREQDPSPKEGFSTKKRRRYSEER